MRKYARAFVSHSSAEKPLVEKVVALVTAARWEIDAYTFDEGATSADEIFRAMSRSSLFVLFASRRAMQSAWVESELQIAQNLLYSGKLGGVLVFIVDDSAIGALPDWLRLHVYARTNNETRIANRIRSKLMQIDSLRGKLFEDSIIEARHGFKIAASMDIVVFGIGIFLVLASAVSILLAGGTLDSWAGVGITGGTGLLGVVYGVLIANPRRQVRESVDHLMNLKVVFLAYLRQLHQTDQAYTRRLLDDRDFSANEVSSFTDMVGRSMTKALSELSPQSRGGSAEISKVPQPSSSPEANGLTTR